MSRDKYCKENEINNDILRSKEAKEILEKLVWETSCVKIGEMYGVSDNAVNKWCKFYEIKKPSAVIHLRLIHFKPIRM